MTLDSDDIDAIVNAITDKQRNRTTLEVSNLRGMLRETGTHDRQYINSYIFNTSAFVMTLDTYVTGEGLRIALIVNGADLIAEIYLVDPSVA